MSDSKVDWDDIAEVNGGTDSTWDGKEVLIGKFLRSQEGVGPNESMMYHIQSEDGKVVGVWGSTVLDTKFQNVRAGSLVRVESLGLKENPKTKRSFKDYSVKVKPLPEAVQEVFPDATEV